MKWVAEFRFGKCRKAYFFKDCDIIGKSEFANPLKDLDIIGKSEFANPLKDCDIIGKSEFANPLKVSDIIGKSEFANPLTDAKMLQMRFPYRAHIAIRERYGNHIGGLWKKFGNFCGER